MTTVTTNLPPLVLGRPEAARHVGGHDVLATLQAEFNLIEAYPRRGNNPARFDRTDLENAWKKYLTAKKHRK